MNRPGPLSPGPLRNGHLSAGHLSAGYINGCTVWRRVVCTLWRDR